MSNFKLFQSLHQQSAPFILGNAWDVQSARTFESAGFKAIATSSAGVAEILGYKDGQNMSFDEYLFMIKRIKASTTLPFTVDLEMGYADSVDGVVENVTKLHALGVAGINIEDSFFKDGSRELIEAPVFAKKIESIASRLKAQNTEVFINLRSDAYVTGVADPLSESLKRIALYQNTGVHGIFLPKILTASDMKAVSSSTHLPINVMAFPGLPTYDEMKSSGIKRISLGPFGYRATFKKLDDAAKHIVATNDLTVLF